MTPEERKRKVRKSIIASLITSTVLALLSYFALPDLKPAFYLMVWMGTFFVWWIWTIMASFY